MPNQNGQKTKSSRKAEAAVAQLREAKARLALRKVQMQEQILAQQQRLLSYNDAMRGRRRSLSEGIDYDGAGLSAQWGQFIDPRGSFPDMWGQGRWPFTTISIPSDRQHGRQWPLWITIQELGYFRQASRILCATNTQAKGMLKNLTNYLIGTGFKYNVIAKDTVDAKADETKAAIRVVQECLDCFLGEAEPTTRMTPWNWREREAFRRTRRDGECFLRLFFRSSGKLEVRFVEPEQIRDPPGATFADGWSYGIQHYVNQGLDRGQGSFEDVETIIKYAVAHKADASEFEMVPCEEMVHLKNVDEDSTVKRGMPDFVYDTLAAFQRAGKLQRNLSEGAALQACIAWIEEFDSATQAQVGAYAGGRAEQDIVVNPSTGQTTPVETWVPGTIGRVPKSKQFKQPPWNEGAPNQIGIVQGDLRQGLAAFCAPEYFSADASNADYSSTKEAGAPFIKCGETDQTYFRTHFLRIVWRAIRWAAKCNVFPPEALDFVTIQVETPVILQKDPLIQAQTDQIYVTSCGLSRQTVLMEQGRDPDVEQANNAEWAEHNPTPGMPDLAGLGGEPPPLATTESVNGTLAPAALIEVPDIRQWDHYSCGAAAAMCVGQYFGVGPGTIDEWKTALGTNVQESTKPMAIASYLQELGLNVEAREKMDLDQLRQYVAKGRPVICCVQDYGPEVPDEAKFEYGHYLTVIGCAMGYVFCQDSSADNVLKGSGSDAAPGKVMIEEQNFLDLWHDRDVDGKKYVRFGIAVGR